MSRESGDQSKLQKLRVQHRDKLETMRTGLLAEIARAFANVTRDGGVSISEAQVIDDYGSDQEQAAARMRDTDRHWSELDPPSQDPGGSAISFMDAIGFRYYVPACMTWVLSQSCVFGGSGDWNGVGGVAFYAAMFAAANEDDRQYAEELFGLFDIKQRRSVARYLALCAIHSCWPDQETSALRGYWLKYLHGTEIRFAREFLPSL